MGNIDSTRLAWCCLKANKQPKSKQNETKEEQCPKWTMVSGAWKERKSLHPDFSL